jgi:hypothetical protein
MDSGCTRTIVSWSFVSKLFGRKCLLSDSGLPLRDACGGNVGVGFLMFTPLKILN